MHCRVCSGGSYAPVTITEYSRRTLLTRRFEFGLRYKRDIRVNYTIKTLSRKNDSTMRVQCTLRGFQDTLKKATIMLQTDKSLWVTLSDEIHWQIWSRGRHQPFVSGAVWNCQGIIELAEGEGVRGVGVSLSRNGGPSVRKFLKFETQFGAIWCTLARNWRFSSFNLCERKHCRNARQWYWHSGLLYFNFLLVWMPFVSCCCRRLACSGRFSWSSFIVIYRSLFQLAYMLTFDNQRL